MQKQQKHSVPFGSKRNRDDEHECDDQPPHKYFEIETEEIDTDTNAIGSASFVYTGGECAADNLLETYRDDLSESSLPTTWSRRPDKKQ